MPEPRFKTGDPVLYFNEAREVLRSVIFIEKGKVEIYYEIWVSGDPKSEFGLVPEHELTPGGGD